MFSALLVFLYIYIYFILILNIYIKNHSNIFLSPHPLQSFHSNWVHALTNNWGPRVNIIEVEQVTDTKVFQAIVDLCTKNTKKIKSNRDFASTPLLFFPEPFFSLSYYCNNLFHVSSHYTILCSQ